MGNTEGSRVISQTFFARRNMELRLTEKQMSIVIGSILGDAYVAKKGKICFEHSEGQKNYLLWKYRELENVAYPKVGRVERFDRRTGKTTVSYRFFLRQFFRPLREWFYPTGTKVLPREIDKWLTPLAVSVWYMDDGSLERGKSPLLATESYSVDELNNMVSLLQKKYGLECLVSAKKNRLRIRSNSRAEFFKLIEPYVFKGMRYKLP